MAVVANDTRYRPDSQYLTTHPSQGLHTTEGGAGQPGSSRSLIRSDFRNDPSEGRVYHGRSAGLDIPTQVCGRYLEADILQACNVLIHVDRLDTRR
jgi:hypothetical protein